MQPNQNNIHLVVGLGATGFSCVRYLMSKNIPVVVVDSRDHPPQLSDCKKAFPTIKIVLGKFQEDLFLQASAVVVSPGVSLEAPCIKKCIDNKIPVMGDVEIFARDATVPIVAITGSNGKSTLTVLMGELIKNAGKKAIVCGNIGLPVLDALMQPVPDFYVVELSSFQLDTTHSLTATVAVVINVSPDHMDRYATVDDYRQSKQKIYLNCEHAVVNADEPEIWNSLQFKNLPLEFTLQKPHQNQWGLCDGFLVRGDKKVISVTDLLLQQRHNNQNFLAALAMGSILKLPMEKMLEVLRSFSGLEHRCQLVKKINEVAWYNDSKATNVGAAIAAIESMGQSLCGNLILLAGGDSKGVSLTPLQNPIRQYVSHVFLYGKDADLLENALHGCAVVTRVTCLREAVTEAQKIAKRGDVVLLAPACASLDQYENYAERGRDFVNAVERLIDFFPNLE